MSLHFSKFNPFRKPSFEEVVVRELNESKLALLEAQAQQEYFKNMVNYLQGKIARLSTTSKDVAN